MEFSKINIFIFIKICYTSQYRDVAQLGSALPWGGRGREFKSHRSRLSTLTLQIFR